MSPTQPQPVPSGKPTTDLRPGRSRRTLLRRRRLGAAVAVAGLLLVVVSPALSPVPASAGAGGRHGAGDGPAPKGVYGAQPLLSFRSFGDPSVRSWAGGWVAVGTGPDALRATAPTANGPWTDASPALAYLPSWAIADRAWASDLAQVNGRWLLYFSVEAAGLPANGRCIGVATASDPTQPFVPSQRPVVCPKAAIAPRAYDRLKHHPFGIPINGVIDPDLFKDRGGQYYLLYRTQAFPASIRIVPMRRDGLPGTTTTVRSQELVRSQGTIENPTLLRRKGQYLLLTSEGFFGGCSYVTTYRRSPDLFDWSGAVPKPLLTAGKTGLCGPGGADVGGGTQNHPVVFFHAWTCPDLGGGPCPPGVDYDSTRKYHAIRSMYGVTLRYTPHHAPRIESYLTPAPPTG